MNQAKQKRWYILIQKYEPIVLILPAFVILLAVVIYPIIYCTGLSFFKVVLTSQERPFIGLNNFRDILGDPKYRRAIITTLTYVLVTVPVSFVLGFGIALLLHGITWGRSLFRVILIIPMTVAPLVVALTWRWMLDPLFGLINWMFAIVHLPPQAWLAQQETAFLTVILVDIWEWSPLVYLIIYAGLSGLPREPYEAAALDGASAWMVFRRITLPMLKPVILVSLLLRTVDAFRTFDIIRAMTDGGPGLSTEVLSLYLYRLAFMFNELGRAAAGAQIMLLIIGLISSVMFRFLYQEVEE